MGRVFIIQTSRIRPGKATPVETTKKVTQSVWSASHPLIEASQVRPNAMNEVNRANWVPV